MVTCRLIAQTGNQLFIIATTIATALRNGTNYLIPRETNSHKMWPCYIRHLPEYKGEPISITYKQPEFSYSPIPFTDNMKLEGYFQSEKYFIDYRKEIIAALNLPYWFKQDIVSIHVRRGDYLKYPTKHPVITKEYITEAMSHFKGKEFLFISDDIGWCKENFPDHYYSEGKTPLGDLALMSRCEHNIIANSSFSWWGAWLNQNPNKKVIAPKIWFGPDNAHLDTKDIIPETWEQI